MNNKLTKREKIDLAVYLPGSIIDFVAILMCCNENSNYTINIVGMIVFTIVSIVMHIYTELTE